MTADFDLVVWQDAVAGRYFVDRWSRGEDPDVNWMRYLVALVVGFVVVTVFDILINAVVLRDVFDRSAHLWRSPEELNRLIPLGWGAMLLMMAFFGLLFVRSGWRGPGRGAEFGLWLGLAAIAGVAGIGTLAPWPGELLAGMAVQQFGNSFLTGLFFGWLYKDRAAASSV